MKLKELYLSLINDGKKYHISELDIRFIFTHHLNLDNSSFYLKLEDDVSKIDEIIHSFELLKSGKPISYVLNEAIFLGNRYYVDNNVLIPRMETEELVFKTLKYIEIFLPNTPLSILDVGSGSGVISIELKRKLKNADVYGIDIFDNVIEICKRNAKYHKVDVKYYKGDTYPNNSKKYNVIVSNPPYIKYEIDVDKSVLDYEPHSALFIKDSNNVYKKIFKGLKDKITLPAILCFEIAPNLIEDLNTLMKEELKDFNFTFIYSKDINNKVRFLTIILK